MTKLSFPRAIRSYVTRKGRMCAHHVSALQQYWPEYGLDVPEDSHFYNWQDVFGRQTEVILEIGFGMGSHLLAMAKANPQYNYVGIEVHEPGVSSVLRLAKQAELKNIRVFKYDAVVVLERCIAANSIDALHLLFPDPWPKRKHHKRRLIQTSFVELVASKLKHEGTFHLATDWQDYADHMRNTMEESPFFVNCYGKHSFAPPSRAITTKFEARGQRLGHDIYDLIYQRQ
jgi:tRNA (guanine-N7-)-methyltransferase